MKKSDGSILLTTVAVMFWGSIVIAVIFGLLNVRYVHVQKRCSELYENEYVYGTEARQSNESL